MPAPHAPATPTSTDAETRARQILASLRASDPSAVDVFDALWELDALPVDEVRDALESWSGPLADPDRLDPAVRRAHGLPLPRLRLRTASLTRDADVLDLGPVAEQQIRIAGTSWDGADLAPEERLDGEIEGSFAGTLERRVLADAASPAEAPLFDALVIAQESGVVFRAGTTDVIALIADGKVELRDGRTRAALEEALFAMPAPAARVADAPSTPSTLSMPVNVPAEPQTPTALATPAPLPAPRARVAEPTAAPGREKAAASRATRAGTNEAAATKGARTKETTKAAAKKAPKKTAKKTATKAAAKKAATRKPVVATPKTRAATKKAARTQPRSKPSPAASKAKRAAKKPVARTPAAKTRGTSVAKKGAAPRARTPNRAKRRG